MISTKTINDKNEKVQCLCYTEERGRIFSPRPSPPAPASSVSSSCPRSGRSLPDIGDRDYYHRVEHDCDFVTMMILNDGFAFDDDHPPLHHLPGEEDIGGVV